MESKETFFNENSKVGPNVVYGNIWLYHTSTLTLLHEKKFRISGNGEQKHETEFSMVQKFSNKRMKLDNSWSM